MDQVIIDERIRVSLDKGVQKRAMHGFEKEICSE